MNVQKGFVASVVFFSLIVPTFAQRRSEAPILKAAAQGKLATVEELLKADATQAKATGTFGTTALHEAVKHGWQPIAKVLLDNGAAVDAVSMTDGTPLQLAAKIGNRDLVELLLDGGANPNVGGDGVRTASPLIIAAGRGHIAVIQALLKRGALVNATDRLRQSALMAAAAAGHLDAVELLVAQKATLDAPNSRSGTALEQALRGGHRKVVEFLIAERATPGPWFGQPPLSPDQLKDDQAVKRRIGEITTAITDFYAACASGDKRRAAECLDLCPPLVNSSEILRYKLPLELAVAAGSTEVVELLLERGADEMKTSSADGGILNQAIKRRKLDLVRLLLPKSGGVNSIRLGAQRTPLGEAVLSGDKEIAEYLLDHGADVNALSWPDASPLYLAAGQDDLAMTKLLLERMADPNAHGHRKMNPLHVAAGRGNRELVELLLSHDADLNAKDFDGATALERAAKAKRREMVELLAGKGRQTSISTWVALGDVERVRTELVTDATQIAKEDSYGLTLLHLAAASGKADMVELLLAKQARPNACDRSGQTALHIAVGSGNLPVAKALLAGKADPNVRDAEGKTPYDEAHDKKMQELLADYGGHIGGEIWPGEIRRGSHKRPAVFEGQSFEVHGYRIYAGGVYRFESPTYSLLLQNVDGNTYSECSIGDKNKQSRIIIDPAKEDTVTLIEINGDKQIETKYKDLAALEVHDPKLIEQYRKLRQDHDAQQIDGDWSIHGPAISAGPTNQN